MKEKVSKNKKAEKIMGLREELMKEGTVPFNQPCELGYHCPVCKYPLTDGKEYDERLEWSEYRGFVWCSVCNKDYPIPLCIPNIDKAIDAYLDIVKLLRNQNHGRRNL